MRFTNHFRRMHEEHFEIMKEYGLEVPADKQKDFEKAVLENYKTVTDYNNQTEKAGCRQ